MEFSTAAAAASGSHMIMQGFNPNAELFGFPGANTNPNPNPNNPTPHGLQDHWHAIEEGFPGNPSNTQGLSLSLSNPMITSPHQEQLFMSMHNPNMNTSPFVLRRSKYLIPAQLLLNEFCNLGGIDNRNIESLKKKEKSSQWEEGGPSNPLLSMDLVELQRRKARLLSMLEEVHRRYRRYCEQMRAVVSSFEAVAGEGAAAAYSALASKAMSRHFRCLKDGITSELRATKAAMGEKDAVTPGTTKGETPRLKKLEQCLRQQKAFLQAGIMESQPWRPQRGLPERSVSVLRAWLFEHFLHPYPSDVDKHILARQTGLSRSQVSNWFINARVRLWKPMVEEMYMEELKDEDSSNLNPSSSHPHADEHKPIIHEHGLFNDSDSLSSIVNNHHHSNGEDHDINNPNPNPNTNSNPNFGVIDLDFSSYNGGGVSLTLGLQQQDRGPMSLSFSPASQQSLFFNRQNIVNDNQAGQFSILDEEGQNLPYRNLMGAQLLHDLAG